MKKLTPEQRELQRKIVDRELTIFNVINFIESGGDVNFVMEDSGFTAHFITQLIALDLRGTYTPLMLSVDSELLDVIKLLLKAGADTTIRNNNGHTALDIAEHNYANYYDSNDIYGKIVKLLKRYSK